MPDRRIPTPEEEAAYERAVAASQGFAAATSAPKLGELRLIERLRRQGLSDAEIAVRIDQNRAEYKDGYERAIAAHRRFSDSIRAMGGEVIGEGTAYIVGRGEPREAFSPKTEIVTADFAAWIMSIVRKEVEEALRRRDQSGT